jgi:hydrogenase expression/formation protein HypE
MVQKKPNIEGSICPIPLSHNDQIVLGHGSGGRMTHDLIRSVFSKQFSNPILDFAKLSVKFR